MDAPQKPLGPASRAGSSSAGSPGSRKRALAVASGGGHWLQLQQLRDAFSEHDVTFVSVDTALASQVPEGRFHAVKDATREEPLDLARCAFQILRLIIRIRPDVVLSTGAAPGLFGLIFGKLFGATTIWVDSVANASQLSLSGELVGPYADLWLTQWPQLERTQGPCYSGSVL